MKILVLLVAVLAVGVLGEEKCEPGTAFMEDCNRCRCTAEGVKACTRRMCPPNELSDEVVSRTDSVTPDTLSVVEEKDEIHIPNGQVCIPNEIKMKECNRCRCANNGIGWFCTRRSCPQREKRESPAPLDEEKCVPGTTFRDKDDCNSCFCTEHGVAACTQKACLPPDFFKNRQRRNTPQTDDLPRSDIAPGAPGFRCTPKATFKYQCNTCICSDDGTMAGCTFKFCVPGEW
ncbi:pacifastin-like protease inhibitor cvp4 isoform X2 [Anopheles nili]|uniref:pacifastin-like protease inhibitor cvp4 isoform X2 n=1 Tax=Anopheles nili TaxID=185578 RepID=UPI00237A3F80|nr:pacifastin-like protease inhibitor cvp4 isoform X2 [Anopheles nili]